MEDSVTATLTLKSATTATTTLRRRNSIATIVVLPKKITVPAVTRSSSTTLPNEVVQAPLASSELDQLSRKSSTFVSYTSLRDLLPSATPPPSVSVSGSDISIRNRLVKQAAWAYLQPMSSSPTSSSSCSCFLRLFPPYLHFFYRRLTSGISWIFHRISRAIWPQKQ